MDGQQSSQDGQHAPQEATGEFGAPPPQSDEAQGGFAPPRDEAYGAYVHAQGDQGYGHEAPRGEQAYGSPPTEADRQRAYGVAPPAEGDQAYNPFGPPSEGDGAVGASSQGDEAREGSNAHFRVPDSYRDPPPQGDSNAQFRVPDNSYRDPRPQGDEGRRGYGGPGLRDEEARGGYERPSEGYGGFRRGSFGEDAQGSYAGAQPHGDDAYASRRGPSTRGDHAMEASFGGQADAWADRFRGKRMPDDTEINSRSYRDQPHAEERFGKGDRRPRNSNLGRVFDGDTLLLRGLPSSVTEDVIRGCFKRSDIPVARITVCVDPETGACKGYAFADLAEPGQLERNMQSVRGMEVGGRRINVELYVPPAAPSSYGGKGAEYGWYGKGKDAWGCGGWSGWPGMWPSWGQAPPWAMMAKGYSAWGGKGGWCGGYGKGAYGPGGADSWGGESRTADPRGDWGGEPGAGGGSVPAAKSSTAGSGGPDGGNLFLGGLAFRAEEKDIRQLFEKNDLEVSKVTVATDRETGKSKGYAFVELRDARQGDRAVRALTGQEICGRPITVEVKGGERGPRAMPGGGADRGPEDRPRDGGGDKRVFVGGVSVLCTDEILREKFAEVGEVVGARIVTDRDTGKPKGFAFVDFATAEDAQRALRKMNNVEICGRQVRVDLPTNSKGGGKGDGPGPPAMGKGLGKGPKFQGLSDNRRKELFGSISPERSKSRSKKRQREGSESGKSGSRSKSKPKRKRRRRKKASSSSS